MKAHQFRPNSLDVLEDRLVLSTVHPTLHAETSAVNPKFLNLTGRTEHQIVNGITAAFARFRETYQHGSGLGPLQDPSFAKLNSDLLAVAHKIPYGGVSLDPTLASLTSGAGGTDPATGKSVISLQPLLMVDNGLANASADSSLISTYETIIRQTVNNYVHQGVTAGEIHLVRGASLPPLTGTGVD